MFLQAVYQNRFRKLLESISPADALFLPSESDVRYLTGFTGDSSALLIYDGQACFITDARYEEQATQEVQVAVDLIVRQQSMMYTVVTHLRKLRHRRLLVPFAHLYAADYRILAQDLGAGVVIENADPVQNLRMVKDSYELEVMRQNLALTELGYHTIIPQLKEGVTEEWIALELEYTLRKQGAQKMAFNMSITIGARSALPHGTASDQPLTQNELLLADFGIVREGYCSDFTRVHAFGEVDSKLREIHSIVREANQAAREAIHPGVSTHNIDAVAREVIKQAGYSEYFGHSTGHGVGLNIHEPPWISARNSVPLSEGMIFTVEPGIYLPGIGGVRLEDMVLVTADGHECLTRTSYDM